MADNKYSVDDILRELNDNKRRTPAPEPEPPREERKPPVLSAPAEEDNFWERKTPQPPPRRADAPPPRRPPARPQREAVKDEPEAEQPRRRPLREPPPGATDSPRLGQNIPTPRNREEMGKLLHRFDDSKQDPLENLDFLEREPEIDYNDTPVKNFVPDWDKKTLQQGGRAPVEPRQPRYRDEPPPARTQREAPQPRYRDEPPPARAQREAPQPRYRDEPPPARAQREAPQPRYRDEPPPARTQREAPQQPRYRDEPPPARAQRGAPPQQQAGYRDETPPQQPRSAAGYREAPRPGASPYGEQPGPQQGGRRELPGMYNKDDRRSMAGAAKLITSGGFEDDDNGDDYTGPLPPQQRHRQAQPQPPLQTPPRPPREPAAQEQPVSRSAQEDVQRLSSYYAAQETQPRRGASQTTQQLPPIPRQGSRLPPPTPTRTMPSTPPLDDTRYDPRIDPRSEEKAEPRAAARDNDKKDAAKRETGQQVASQLKKMRMGLFLRVIVNLLAMVGVVYLALAGEYDFPLPEFIAGEENIGAFLWSAVGMVIVSALISGNTIGGGILALFKLSPSNDSYSALAVFACLIQGSYLAMQPQLMSNYGDNLYLPMAALMLLFNTLGKLILLTRMGGSFRFAAAKGDKHVADIMDNREFARRISGDIVGEEPKIAYFGEATTVDGFLEQAFSESKAEDISKIVAPVTALAALIMALVSYLFSRDIFVAACVYTAALCITAPLAGVIASNLPLSITNGKLARFGASLCGYEAVNRFADTNGVLLRCSQLFPKGSVAIQEIKVLDRRPIDQVITDAASVLCACDSNLSGIFRDMIQDSSMLHQPENLEYFDDMGLSAWVNGRRVLIGNRSLMMSYGVSIPGVEFERPYTVGNNEVMYLSNSGEAAAMYVLTYRADKQMRRAMELMCDRDMAVCVYSTDPNLTAEKISNIYSFPKELISIIPASMQAGSEKYMEPKVKSKASAVHNGTPASYLRTILAAQSCSKCITLETALILVSVVIGFAIVTFFAFTQQMESLTWITIAVYQFFWLLIELVIPLVKH